MVKDIKEELEKGKRYHAASKEEKKILANKLFKEENKPTDSSSKDFIDDIAESSGEIFNSIKKGISSLPKNFKNKTNKETPKKKQISDMSREELINEVAETKYKSLSPKQLLGGCIGIIAYIIAFYFQATLEEFILLAAFMPAVMATGGSVGIQSSAIIIRGLGMGSININQALKIISKV